MQTLRNTIAGGIAGLLVAASQAHAQLPSLADVARREEARRTTVTSPAKIYTNSDLNDNRNAPLPPMVAAVPSVGASSAGSANSSPSTVAAADQAAAAQKPEALDESYWRRLAAGHKVRVERARAELAAVSIPSDSGDDREQAKLAALRERAQATLSRAEQAQKDFEVQADLKKVPKIWIQ